MRNVCCSGRLGVGVSVCLGECLPRGCLLKGGVCLGSEHLPPWTEWQMPGKNITFPQLLLRTVTRLKIISQNQNSYERSIICEAALHR